MTDQPRGKDKPLADRVWESMNAGRYRPIPEALSTAMAPRA